MRAHSAASIIWVNKEYELKLLPGTAIFLYTEGVPEAQNDRGEMFGLERAADTLNRAREDDPEKLVGSMDRSIHDFVMETEQFDDITMLCIKYNGGA